MAVDNQDYTAIASLIPFETLYPEPDRYRTSEPFGRLIHREPLGDDVTLDGSGAGDTARLRLFFNLPDKFVFRLTSLRLLMYTTDVNWGQAYAECYLIPLPNRSDNKTLVNFPLSRDFGAVSVPGVETNITFTLGQTGNPSQSHGASPSPYSQLPLFYGGGGSASGLVLNIPTSTDTSPAGTFSYYAEWLVYNVEQARRSALWWPVPVT